MIMQAKKKKKKNQLTNSVAHSDQAKKILRSQRQFQVNSFIKSDQPKGPGPLNCYSKLEHSKYEEN